MNAPKRRPIAAESQAEPSLYALEATSGTCFQISLRSRLHVQNPTEILPDVTRLIYRNVLRRAGRNH